MPITRQAGQVANSLGDKEAGKHPSPAKGETRQAHLHFFIMNQSPNVIVFLVLKLRIPCKHTAARAGECALLLAL